MHSCVGNSLFNRRFLGQWFFLWKITFLELVDCRSPEWWLDEVATFAWFALHLHKTSQYVMNINKFPLFSASGLWYCKQWVKILKRMFGFSTLERHCVTHSRQGGVAVSRFSHGRRFDVKTGELSFKSLQSDKLRNRLSAVDWHCLLENGLWRKIG